MFIQISIRSSQLTNPFRRFPLSLHAVLTLICNNGLSPYDFDLIPKMKEPVRGIRFRTVAEIL